jgi:DNA polymerase-1
MKKRTLIVDGDIYAFQGSAGAEEATNWGTDDDDGCIWRVVADESVAKAYIDRSFEELMDNLEATDLVVTLSDTVNWRKSVLPTYKGNRNAARRPIILPQMREYLRTKYDAWQRPTLEGDDLLGILSGLHGCIQGEKIMVTLDKDMSTLAGLHYRPHKSVLGIFEVTPAEADKFHLMQGIAGDPTDGYTGCPSWGMKTAEEFLNEPYKLVPETYTPSRGKFAGEEKTRWVKQECDDLWECIVSLFAKEGVSEADAIVQFQVARILRVTDYDFNKKEPILWTPNLIQ